LAEYTAGNVVNLSNMAYATAISKKVDYNFGNVYQGGVCGGRGLAALQQMAG